MSLAARIDAAAQKHYIESLTFLIGLLSVGATT
jgi:hypothetical protein